MPCNAAGGDRVLAAANFEKNGAALFGKVNLPRRFEKILHGEAVFVPSRSIVCLDKSAIAGPASPSGFLGNEKNQSAGIDPDIYGVAQDRRTVVVLRPWHVVDVNGRTLPFNLQMPASPGR